MAHEWVMSPDGEWDKYVEEKVVVSWNDLDDRPFRTITERNRVVLHEQDYYARWNGYVDMNTISFIRSSIFSDLIITLDGVEYSDGVTYSFDASVGADVYNVNGVEDVYFSQAVASGTPAFHCPSIVKDNTYHLKVEVWKNIETNLPIDSKYLPKASSVSDAASDTIVEQFNALLSSLRTAGYLAE